MLRIAPTLLLLVFGVCPSKAVLIVEHQSAGSNTNLTLAASAADPAISASPFAAGSGIDAIGIGTYNFNGWDTGNTSFAEAVADDEVFTWGFEVTDAVALKLTDFEIRLDRTPDGPDDFEIQVTVNGGTPISVLTHDFNDAHSEADIDDFTGVSLSPIPLLSQGDSVVFTLGAYNAQTDSGGFDLETIGFFDDPRGLRVHGTLVSVPEPAAALFGSLLAGALGMTVARRPKSRD